MNSTTYTEQFEEILEGRNTAYPYDSEAYVNYVKLNQRRIKRWNKTGKLLPELEEKIKKIEDPQNWLLITEPWCGDAAHSQVFIEKLADLNPNINLNFQNRDATGSEIENYLTNGSKSIPMLVVRDANNKDIFTWGPRPKEAQEMVMSHKTDTSISAEDKKKELQGWYNKDKGTTLQEELNQLIKEAI